MDYQTTSTLLTWMIFTPLIGSVAILLLLSARSFLHIGRPGAREESEYSRHLQKFVDNGARAIGLATTFIVAVLGVVLWAGFDGRSAGLQFVHHTSWMPSWNIEYFVGVDGISITMVILSGFIFLVAAIA
ncbi:MAG TPA: hypothetical protein VLL97_01605, partial [Acidobacteriota bacterium]|nr:hypothetical protein [Acidobacteriota bacterium]